MNILQNIQMLIGYSRTHGEDEKFVKKIRERIEDLAETMENYNLLVVDYSEDCDRWFEKVPSPNTVEPRMAFPAIVRGNEVILLGKIFVPEH